MTAQAALLRESLLEQLSKKVECDAIFCHGYRVAHDKQLYLTQLSYKISENASRPLRQHLVSLHDALQGLPPPEGAMGFGFRVPVNRRTGDCRVFLASDLRRELPRKWSLRFPRQAETNQFVHLWDTGGKLPVSGHTYGVSNVEQTSFSQTRLYRDFYGHPKFRVCDSLRCVLRDEDNLHVGHVELLSFQREFITRDLQQLNASVGRIKSTLLKATQLEAADLTDEKLLVAIASSRGRIVQASPAAKLWLESNGETQLAVAIQRYHKGGPARWVSGAAEVNAAHVASNKITLVIRPTAPLRFGWLKFSPVEFEAARLKALSNGSQKQVAEAMKVSQGAAKTYLGRVNKFMREKRLSDADFALYFFSQYPEESPF